VLARNNDAAKHRDTHSPTRIQLLWTLRCGLNCARLLFDGENQMTIVRKTRSRVQRSPRRTGPLTPQFLLTALFALAAGVPARLLAQSASASDATAAVGGTLTGIDVLEGEQFRPLVGKRVALITNHTGIDRVGRSTVSLLAHAPGVKLVALFSPEHGIAGTADASVAASVDPATGLTVYSLYGATNRPTDAMLSGVDALVFDVQDAGVRFYTYITTMGYAMEAAAQHHIAFLVLDRPDPLGGERVEGPMLDPGRTAFTAYFPMTVIPGMTLGEMARMFNQENHIGCDLHVIAMRGWRRSEWFDETGLRWVDPSPNLRSFQAEIIYPGLEILQNAGVSVGRGTDTPFEQFGAPWIHGEEFVDELNGRSIPGARFAAVRFTPTTGLYQGELCQGARVEVTNRAAFNPMRMGLEIAAELSELYPQTFEPRNMMLLLGSEATIEQLEHGDAPETIVDRWKEALAPFMAMRAKYLLYP
jgi:uncharacterized protein YbbC (DUF1343 family)